MTVVSPLDYITALSEKQDSDIILGEAAVYMAALEHEGISIDRFLNHLKTLVNEVCAYHADLLSIGEGDTVYTRLDALRTVIADHHGYNGDMDTPDDIQNVNLIRVIERATGGSIALSILYMHVGRVQGWHVDGLDISGRFACRIEQDGVRVIFDPFSGARVLEAHDLRQVLKETLGDEAELSAQYYEEVSNRHILVALHNVVKYKKIAAEDYDGALSAVSCLRLVAPHEYSLLLDEGVLNAKLSHARAAISSLEKYLERAPHGHDRYEAEALLHELRRNLN